MVSSGLSLKGIIERFGQQFHANWVEVPDIDEPGRVDFTGVK